MFCINKVSKLALVASLFLASASCIHAMESDPDHWQNQPHSANFQHNSDELTEEQFAALLQQMQEEDHPSFRYRAQDIPESKKDGEPLNIATKGLGDFILNDVELNPNRDEMWTKRALQNEKQMKDRVIIEDSPKIIQDIDEKQRELQAKRVKELQRFEAKGQQETITVNEEEIAKTQAARLKALEELEAARQKGSVDQKVSDTNSVQYEEIAQYELPKWNSQLKNTLGGSLPDDWRFWSLAGSDIPEFQQEREGELTGTGNCFGVYHCVDLSGFIGKTIEFTADIKSDNPGPYYKLETQEEFWSSLHKGNNKWENLSMKYVVEPADSYVVYFETKQPASFTMKNLNLKVHEDPQVKRLRSLKRLEEEKKSADIPVNEKLLEETSLKRLESMNKRAAERLEAQEKQKQNGKKPEEIQGVTGVVNMFGGQGSSPFKKK